MAHDWLNLELTHPGWLAGLLVLPVLVYYFYRGLVDFARWQKVGSLATRTAVVVLLVLALAGLTLLRPTRDQFVVFAIDRSVSVGDASRKAADEFVDRATKSTGRHKAAFVSFGNAPGLVRDKRPAESEKIDDQGTNLASAIEVAAAACPPFFVPKIVLLSDGNATTGDAVKTALRAGVSVSTVPLRTRD